MTNTPPPPTNASPSHGVVAAAIAGNALEFYDFVTYSFFAVYIGQTFFPAGDPFLSLLISVAVFGVGFVSRPLGGILIGAYADKAGRRPAMLLTIALITLGTLGLALTPSYASIGIAAPLIVVACRLIQGLALGGEVGPSTAYLVEVAPAGKRGFYASWQLASQGMAIVVAGAMGVAMTLLLSPADLASWGWRVPFLVGLLLLPIAIYMRRNMGETLEQHANPATKARIKPYTRLILLSILVILGGTVSTYVNNYMTTYAITTLHMAPAISMAATVVTGVCVLVFALIGGLYADKLGRKWLMIAPRLALAVVTYPAFMLLVAFPKPVALLLVTALLAALTGLTGAASLVAVPELFPREIRATALSVSYAIGVALFGGSTQFIVTWLIHATGNPLVPGMYVAGASVITLWAMWVLPETKAQAV